MSYQIPIIIGTGRTDNTTQHVAKYVESISNTYENISAVLIDIKEFTPQLTSETAQNPTWPNVMDKSDALIIVAPEYNHSFSGELKLFLDQAYSEYAHKPVGIIGVSSGVLGGARMVEQLRLVTIALQMIPMKNAVYVGNILGLNNLTQRFVV